MAMATKEYKCGQNVRTYGLCKDTDCVKCNTIRDALKAAEVWVRRIKRHLINSNHAVEASCGNANGVVTVKITNVWLPKELGLSVDEVAAASEEWEPELDLEELSRMIKTEKNIKSLMKLGKMLSDYKETLTDTNRGENRGMRKVYKELPVMKWNPERLKQEMEDLLGGLVKEAKVDRHDNVVLKLEPTLLLSPDIEEVEEEVENVEVEEVV